MEGGERGKEARREKEEEGRAWRMAGGKRSDRKERMKKMGDGREGGWTKSRETGRGDGEWRGERREDGKTKGGKAGRVDKSG